MRYLDSCAISGDMVQLDIFNEDSFAETFSELITTCVTEKHNSIKNPYICSPMNYIGGKFKLLPQIMPLFPRKIKTFVDLFCGGCNVGINVFAEKIVFNDNISYLIDLYNVFQRCQIKDLLEHIQGRIAEYKLSLTNECGYKELRKLYNEQRDPIDLFVLVAYSFNHQIRFNNSHEFNNPFGKKRSCYNARIKENLVSFVDQLQKKNVSFCCNNFDSFNFSKLSKDDFVYCDPPYLITTGTYNDGKRGFTGWGEIEEKKLLSILDYVNQRKIKFALSNVLEHRGKKNNLLLNWIADNKYYLSHFKMNYANSNYHAINNENQRTDEVLITNYDPKDLTIYLELA